MLGKFKTAKRRRTRPRILICTPEITELPEGMGNAAQYIRVKGGGLGDISAGLIQHLHEDRRFDLHVVLPRYDAKIRDFARINHRDVDLLARVLDRKGIHLVSDSAFSSLADIYGDSEVHPRIRRAEAFQRYIINDLLDRLEPDVVHCNDWMTALVPAAAKSKGIKSLFTLHNVFTEYATPRDIDRSGIDVRRFQDQLYYKAYPEFGVEHWTTNEIDFTASGIHAADIVNTVSPTFLKEIVRGDFEDVIPPSVREAVCEKHTTGHALGILNSPGDNVDPRITPHITSYDVDDVMEKKRVNKEQFQTEMGLRRAPDAPLFLWPSRLYEQKGPELLIEIALRVIQEHDAQIAFVSNGDRALVSVCRSLALASGGRLAHRPFSESLSILGMAGADFVLMPSLYEPCGLPQMIGPRFGTLPIVRATGGLRDTVTALDLTADTGNGFVFEAHRSAALARAIADAASFYGKGEEVRQRTLQRVMTEGFENHSLANTAREYIRIYETLIAESA